MTSNREYTMRQAYLEAHIAVLLWAFTAIIGDVVALSALVIVWWRVLIASVILAPYTTVKVFFADAEKRSSASLLCFNGCLLGLHWLTFYATVKLSNASLTLICMSLTPLFTALIEAWTCRKPLRRDEIFLALVIIPAMAFIAAETKPDFHLGICVGIASSLLSAMNNALNKRLVGSTTPLNITFVQMLSGLVLLSLFLPFQFSFTGDLGFFPSTSRDAMLIAFLGVFCTALTFVLAMRSLRHLSAFALSLTIGLEPVYGIVLAALLLNDARELTQSFYSGASIIIFAVAADAISKKFFRKLRTVQHSSKS